MTQSIFKWAEGQEFNAISEEELKRFDELGEFLHYCTEGLETLISLARVPLTDRELFNHVKEKLEAYLKDVHKDATTLINDDGIKFNFGRWMGWDIRRFLATKGAFGYSHVDFKGVKIQREQFYSLMRTCARGNVDYLSIYFGQFGSVDDCRGISIKDRNIVAISFAGYDSLSDVSPLAELPGLQALYLQRTGVEDISPFYTSASLKILDVGDTEVPADQIEEIKARIPGLEVST